MHYRFVIQQLGLLLIVLALAMGVVAAVEGYFYFTDQTTFESLRALLTSFGTTLVLGGILWLIGFGQKPEFLGRREAVLLVAVTWFIGGAVAALPFYIWAHMAVDFNADGSHGHVFHRYAGAYFEAISGLTTTGATVVSDITGLPPGMKLWRAVAHWLGGLGIVVLFVAVLPLLGVGGKRLFQAEAPGPKQQGVRPRIKQTARLLWLIYLGLTLSAFFTFKLCGMTWFEATCHAFSVMSTGGFSTESASIAAWDSAILDYAVSFYMLLAGVNFVLFYYAVSGKWKLLWENVELRVYMALKLTVIVLITLNVWHEPTTTTSGEFFETSLTESVRYSAFQTIALHTGTGFGTADYDSWPIITNVLLFGLMMIGGCAGSTAGGIKVIRFWITIRVFINMLEKSYRPNVVRPLRIGKSVVDADMKLGAVTYVMVFTTLVILGSMVLMVVESSAGQSYDLLTFITASLATLGNVGPGMRLVGPTDNYGWFSDFSLYFMSLFMVLGRLEIFAVFILFLPSYWKGE